MRKAKFHLALMIVNLTQQFVGIVAGLDSDQQRHGGRLWLAPLRVQRRVRHTRHHDVVLAHPLSGNRPVEREGERGGGGSDCVVIP